MKKQLGRPEITSLISQSLDKCPHSLDCVALFGSFVKRNHFRDIDILVVVSNKEEVKASEQWMKRNIQTLLKIPLDIQCYDFESFLELAKNQAHLTLSIAVEGEFIIGNTTIEQELTSTKEYLYDQGVNMDNDLAWKIDPKVINNILSKEYEPLRGFLVSHLDWIENPTGETEKLLRYLTPIEEPYTRVACFKQVNRLLSSEEYRKQLNIPMTIPSPK